MEITVSIHARKSTHMRGRVLVALALSAVFVLSMALMWPRSPERPAQAAAVPEVSVPVADRWQDSDSRRPPVAGAQPVTLLTPPSPVRDMSSGDFLAPEMPADFLFQAAGTNSPAAAVLLNMSNLETLEVKVIALDPQTHLRSYVEVSASPGERVDLIDKGLNVSSGNEVTLQVVGYRDLVRRAH